MRTKDLITINEPHSMVSESYKMFRTNLKYLNIDKGNKVILFTSASAEEGKTTSISNAAICFAQEGKKVLLLECDLRRARVHTLFDIPQSPGLSNVLADKQPLKEAVRGIEEVPGLHILTGGVLPPNPAELLASHALETLIEEAREVYDLILIDAPPVLAVTDALVLNRLVDGTVLVLAAKETKKDAAKHAKKSLDKVGAHIMGVLLTKCEAKRHRSYYYYGNKAE